MCRTVRIYFSLLAVTKLVGADVCSVIHMAATQWSVNCSDRNLTSIPDFTDRPVSYLNLHNNSLTSNVTFRGWKYLKFVDLSYNKLYTIENDTFDGFDELGSLNVSYCSLKSISSPHLKGKMRITSLDLSGNPLLPLSDDFESTLNESLDQGTQTLHICKMDITHLTQDVLSSGNSLRRLHMRDNRLRELPVFPSNLNYLDVSNNSFVTLNSEPFALCAELKTLIIEYNAYLIDIDEDAFRYMENLTTLSLKGNRKLEFLPDGIFIHNQNLENLSIAGCNFKTLSPYFKPVFLDLKFLELHDNLWYCNPSIKWLSSLNSSSLVVSTMKCSDGVAFDQHYGLLKQTVVKNMIILLVAMTFSFFALGAWYAYDLEKKRRSANPYWPLGKSNPLSSPVYVSTVV